MVERSYGVIPVKLGGLEPQYLIVQHSAGHWGFPKGHAEPGETATAAAKRELLKETGIRDCSLNDQVFFIEQYRYSQDELIHIKEVKLWLGQCPAGTAGKASGEIKRLRWVTRGEGLDILTFQTTKDILRQVSQYLQSHDQNQWF